ncbi:hypothetical protein RB653_009174 [Dictyostelium firmibasis]|uniref:Uncharacterized protein n=1 Tax=Dictyostelium firmibasis TaxID=79012 RepID=A0AAN7U1I9_9MYCE
MKLILPLIILIIAFSNAAKISKDESISIKTKDSGLTYINFLPYDENCKNQIPGIGFGTIGGTYCVGNITQTFGSTLTAHIVDDSNEYVNLTSSTDDYCTNQAAGQIFKVGQCAYYEWSKTNYYVSITNEPQIPSGSYAFKDEGDTCDQVFSYWFMAQGTIIPDYFLNQTSTYTCSRGTPYVTVCNGLGNVHTPSECVYLKNVQTCFNDGYNSQPYNIYCS